MPSNKVSKKRRIMHEFTINEISAVDVPAQEGATMLIMKRKTPSGKVTKNSGDSLVVLTDPVNGHSHAVWIYLDTSGGTTHYSRDPESESDHDHPWVIDRSGRITIGMNDGHTHEVTLDAVIDALMAAAASHVVHEVSALVGKSEFSSERRKELADEGKALPDGSFPIVTREDLTSAVSAFGRATDKTATARHIKQRATALDAEDVLPEDGKLANLIKLRDAVDAADGDVGTQGGLKMTDPTKKAADGNQPTVEELQAKLVRATSVAGLNDAEKAYFAILESGGADQDTFLGKSADDRKVIVDDIAKAAEDQDPVVYTTTDGVELRKSAGAALIAVIKKNDTLSKQIEKLQDDKTEATYEKRAADELPNMPGDIATRAAMLKAIDGITDETQRTAAHKALKAQNDVMKSAFETLGTNAVPTTDPSSPQGELDSLAKKHQEANPESSEAQSYDFVLKTQAGKDLYSKTLN